MDENGQGENEGRATTPTITITDDAPTTRVDDSKTSMGILPSTTRRGTTIHNWESDSDYDSDQDASATYQTLELPSAISINDSEITEVNGNINATTTSSSTPTSNNTENLTISYDWEPEATSTQTVNAVTNADMGNTSPKNIQRGDGGNKPRNMGGSD